MSNKITIEVRLSDEDRALLAGVQASAKGRTAKPAKAVVAEENDEDNFEGTADDDSNGDAADDVGDDTGDVAEPTKADVHAALREYAEVTSKSEAMKLIKTKGGSDSLSDLKPAKYAAVIVAAKAATKKAAKAAK